MKPDTHFIIEQPKLSEPCPCGSHKEFGKCCGRENPCECNSHLLAAECCYQVEEAEQSLKKSKRA